MGVAATLRVHARQQRQLGECGGDRHFGAVPRLVLVMPGVRVQLGHTGHREHLPRGALVAHLPE